MTASKSIYPSDGRAKIYRHPDRYEFLVSGTGPYPEFIYKIVRAPLDADAAALGQLAVQSIATEVSARVNLDMVDKFMIPLDASAEQIGAAILKAFAAIDSRVAQASRAPRKLDATTSRRPKKTRRS